MPSSSTAFNAMLTLGAATSANANAAVLLGDDSPMGQAFAQLLSDLGTGTQDQGTQNFSRGQVLPGAALPGGSVLSAQDMNLEALAAQTLPLEQLITPKDAATILARVDAIAATPVPAIPAVLLGPLKDQLQKIVDTGAPKTVAAMLAVVPALKEHAVPARVMSALFETPKLSADAKAETEEAPTQVLAAMQTMSAMMFRPARGENASAAPATQQKKKERDIEETITVIQPLAYTMQAVQAAPTVEVTSTDAAPLQAVNPANDDGLRANPVTDWDQRIPSLKLDAAKNDAADALPEVSLPKFMLPAQALPTQSGAPLQALVSTESLASDEPMVRRLGAIDTLSATSDITYPSSIQLGISSAVHHTAKTVDMIAIPGFVNHAPVTDQVQVAIHQANKDGIDRITIQLDPVDLGRVEINMQTNKDGQTQIYFTIDKPDTFDSLSRDARTLERSLQEAGIKADTGSMQFNLRQQPQPQMQSGLGGNGQPQQQPSDADEESKHSAVTGISSVAALTRNYIVNIREGVDISA